MNKRSTKQLHDISTIAWDQSGMSAIETSIVLIAFVVVASVFGFAMLNTGILSSQKEQKVVQAGIDETSSNLILRGGVLAIGNGGKTGIDTIKFYLTPVVESGGSTDLSSSGVVVTYVDSANSLNCTSGGSGSCSWATNWVIGSGDLVDPGERVEMIVTLSGLTPLLGKNTEFTIEVRPNKDAVVVVNRTIPGEVKAVMELY
ncbi:MAG: hypothetical protein MK210_13645 [Dehalococcoidia bacterium]|nr:hypothetical protein [Dehalococcoidia bacterium]